MKAIEKYGVMDFGRVFIGIVFVFAWALGTAWSAFVLRDAEMLSRFGSLGAVGTALISLFPYKAVIDRGTAFSGSETRLHKVWTAVKSWQFWAIILITITTVQWGFGDLVLFSRA